MIGSYTNFHSLISGFYVFVKSRSSCPLSYMEMEGAGNKRKIGVEVKNELNKIT